ncbi:MAG: sensor domain-containing diguanylate cyclase [Chitinispirillales bacterium]|jgi:diguanylate cyclase (GGDEF)-like protein|nr:sensor domain-containing diguanylate cyclase [Chitinispirillales bacterium]
MAELPKEPANLHHRRKVSMQRRFVIFSTLLFLVIFIAGTACFVVFMSAILRDSTGYSLSRTVKIERLKLENHVNSEIAIVTKMAGSPLLKAYFENPESAELGARAFEEIAIYRETFIANTVFWINDIDKKFYFDDAYAYTVDPAVPENYWYDLTLYRTERYNFNINYNPELDNISLWINAPVFNSGGKPIGMVGTGIDLTAFINTIYTAYAGPADLYFFNRYGEITGARNTSLVADKRKLDDYLGEIGRRTLAKAKALDADEITFFTAGSRWDGTVAVGKVEALEWYAVAILPFRVMDALKTHLTLLFAAMMVIIASVFVAFNLFVMGLFGPLNSMVRALDQISADWDAKNNDKSEVETLGAFLDMAITDPLTNLYNRRYMDGNLDKLIKSLSRANQSKLSVLMVDVDHFKKYNDAYGHDEGDRCLKTIASVLSQSVARVDDFVARYGGEEFAVILPNTDEAGAWHIANKLLETIRECKIPHKGNEAAGSIVTISIGGATAIVTHSQNASNYMKRADRMLYASKKNGRNRYTHEAF